MMHNLKILIMLLIITMLATGCAIKSPITHNYKLESFSNKKFKKTAHPPLAILVTQPEAVSGYQTEKMLYVTKPFTLQSFVHNAWIGAPAKMLFPLILQSLRHSGYFYAVIPASYIDKADYRLDTQLLALQQNFLTKPSHIILTINTAITHIKSKKVIASKIIHKRIPCPDDSPYGGVIAANQATNVFTAELTDFIVTQVERDKHRIEQSGKEKTI